MLAVICKKFGALLKKKKRCGMYGLNVRFFFPMYSRIHPVIMGMESDQICILSSLSVRYCWIISDRHNIVCFE
jgi:hypothetical protein